MLKKLVTSVWLIGFLNVSTSNADIICGTNTCKEVCEQFQQQYVNSPNVNIIYTTLFMTADVAIIGCKNTLYDGVGFNEYICSTVLVSNCTEDVGDSDGSENQPTISGNGSNDPRVRCGSIIETANQVIGESIPLVGYPFFLTHYSSRSKGRIADYTAKIPLSGTSLSSRVTGFVVEIRDDQSHLLTSSNMSAGINKSYSYQWNGLENALETWGARKKNITIKTSVSSGAAVADKVYDLTFGNFKAQKLGLGGWLPSIWHFYDSVAEKVYHGDGSSRVVKAVSEGSLNRVPNKDGSEVYYFDHLGRIVYTKTGLTGTILYSFNYRSDEKLSSITDAHNKVTRFNYNSSGNLVEIVSSENIKTKFTHDLNGLLLSVINPKNEIFQMTYQDVNGLLLTFKKPSGNVTSFTYDQEGKLLTDINSSGFKSSLLQTDQGINAVSALGRLTQNNYNKVDSSEIEVNPSGLSTKYTFTKTADSVILPYASFKTTYGNDPRFGDQVKSVTKVENNNFGSMVTNIESTVDLNDLTNPFSINTLSKTVTEGNSEITSHYNGLTRTKTVMSKLGRSIATQVDQLERPVLEQVGEFAPKKYQYQENLLTKMSQGERNLVFTYHPQTKLLQSVKNSENLMESFQYDEAQRLKSKTLSDGRVILYSYDSNGILTSLTPPGRPAHRQIYGTNEKISSYNPPLLPGVTNVNTAYNYNLDKELTKITRPDGKEINFNYGQETGLLDSISGSFGTISREYNQERVAKITDQNNQTVNFGYNGDVVNSMTLRDQNQQIVYEYQRAPLPNSNRLIENETLSAGNKNHSFTYGYDDDNFLTKAGDINLSYNIPNGSLKETSLQNIKEEYFYNNFGEVKEFRSYYLENNKKNMLYSYVLKRDKIGRIISKIESFGKDEENRRHHRGHSNFCRHHKDDKKIDSEYFYDKAGRLVKVRAEKRPDSIYLYDSNSNRIAGVATGVPFVAIYDNQDRLIRFNNETYSYNANGELFSKSERVKNTYINTAYSYDVFGGLKLAGNVTYQIDPLQRRIAKLVNIIVVRKYAYNPEGQLIGELNSQGNLLKSFIYASKSHVPDYFIDQNNELFKLIVDHLGSIRLVVKASTGEITQKMNHDEFGKILQDSNPGFTPFGFAGGLYDPETNLVRFGARDYDPQTGRWLSKDPIRFDGGDMNLYGYVMNDPVNLIDPSGKIGILAVPATLFLIEVFENGFGRGIGEDPDPRIMNYPEWRQRFDEQQRMDKFLRDIENKNNKDKYNKDRCGIV